MNKKGAFYVIGYSFYDLIRVEYDFDWTTMKSRLIKVVHNFMFNEEIPSFSIFYKYEEAEYVLNQIQTNQNVKEINYLIIDSILHEETGNDEYDFRNLKIYELDLKEIGAERR